jgi:hypothetical protein
MGMPGFRPPTLPPQVAQVMSRACWSVGVAFFLSSAVSRVRKWAVTVAPGGTIGNTID